MTFAQNLSKKPVFKRPDLILPPDEAAWVKEVYGAADTILEYGSGGSTVLAAELPQKTIFSVESDAEWARNMQTYIDGLEITSSVTVHHADIGPTRPWGYPDGEANWRKFAAYALGIWDVPGFVQPDIALIDGRFRAGCMLACLFRTTKPMTIYFDDYMNRPDYHVVEEFTPRIETRGRMARFDIEPTPIPADRLVEIVAMLQAPR